MTDVIMLGALTVGFVTMMAGYGLAIFDRLRGRSTKGQSPPLKIPFGCQRTFLGRGGSNFIVELQYPGGVVIRVLIPVDSRCWKHQYKRISGRDEPIGLNLVCSGHYT